MNFRHMPELSWGFGYGYALILMVVTAAAMLLVERARVGGLGVGRTSAGRPGNRVIDARNAEGRPARGRYVRLYSKGNTSNDMNHYVEVEVYGTPAK